MRRATAMLLGTVAGTALLVGAKYGTAATSNTANAGSAIGPQGGTASTDPNASPTGTSPSSDPASAPAAPAGSAAAAPVATKSTAATRKTTAPAAPRTTTPATTQPAAPTTAAPACSTASGVASTVVSPGVGAMTVTIKVCGGVVSSSTGALSQSNWSLNNQAIPQLNTLAVQYYKTDISKLHYSQATLTSNAYQASLKSALSKAGI